MNSLWTCFRVLTYLEALAKSCHDFASSDYSQYFLTISKLRAIWRWSESILRMLLKIPKMFLKSALTELLVKILWFILTINFYITQRRRFNLLMEFQAYLLFLTQNFINLEIIKKLVSIQSFFAESTLAATDMFSQSKWEIYTFIECSTLKRAAPRGCFF